MKTLHARLALLLMLLLTLTACDFYTISYAALLWWGEPLGVQWAGVHSQPGLLRAGTYTLSGRIIPGEGMFIQKARWTGLFRDDQGSDTDRIRKTIRVRNNEFSRTFTLKEDLRLEVGHSWLVQLEALPRDEDLHMADLNVQFRWDNNWENVEGPDYSDLDLDIEFLLDDVEELVAAGTLRRRQGATWTSSLETARTLLEDGHEVRAMMELLSFTKQVNEAAESGSLSRQEAEDLTLTADGIADELMVPAR